MKDKKDYFAAAALTGILSNAETMKELTRAYKKSISENSLQFEEYIGELAYIYADGMINSQYIETN